jgi:putative ABC transport system ATP-binding protein
MGSGKGIMHLTFEEISYSLGREPTRHLKVSGTVNEGEVLVIQGSSGAGKTTLLRIMARLQTYDGGNVYLQGKHWQQFTATVWRSSVHYLAQRPVLFDGTVGVNLAMPFETRVMKKKNFNPDLAQEFMQKLHLPPGLWEQDARTLSGGEASRIAFIRALLIDPKLMLLDEPTAGLDEKSREAFYQVLVQWLRGPERAALLVSHNDHFENWPQVSFLELEPLGKEEYRA